VSNFDNIADDILNGQLDDQLDALMECIRDRRKAIEKRVFRSLKPGDKVRYKEGTNPQYLVGATGTIVKINRTRVRVALDETVGKFPKGLPIGTPVSMIEKV